MVLMRRIKLSMSFLVVTGMYFSFLFLSFYFKLSLFLFLLLRHGCQLCYTASTFNENLQLTQRSVYQRTIDRLNNIQQLMPDYKIIKIWEHQWDRMVEHNKTCSNYLQNNKSYEPIKLRDALFGGMF